MSFNGNATSYCELLSANGLTVRSYKLEADYQLTNQDITLTLQWYQTNFDK